MPRATALSRFACEPLKSSLGDWPVGRVLSVLPPQIVEEFFKIAAKPFENEFVVVLVRILDLEFFNNKCIPIHWLSEVELDFTSRCDLHLSGFYYLDWDKEVLSWSNLERGRRVR